MRALITSIILFAICCMGVANNLDEFIDNKEIPGTCKVSDNANSSEKLSDITTSYEPGNPLILYIDKDSRSLNMLDLSGTAYQVSTSLFKREKLWSVYYCNGKIWTSDFKTQFYPQFRRHVPCYGNEVYSVANDIMPILSEDVDHPYEIFMSGTGDGYNHYRCLYSEFNSSSLKPKGCQFAVRDNLGNDSIIKVIEDEEWRVLQADRHGQLWAVNEMGELLKIDKISGEVITRMQTHMSFANAERMQGVIDRNTDILYVISKADDENATIQLHKIPLETGIAEKVDTFVYDGESIPFIFHIPYIAYVKAPAAPENVKFICDDKTLECSLSFTAPVVTFDGDALDTNLTWKLKSNGNVICEGSTTPGANESKSIQIGKSGILNLELTIDNQYGEGVKWTEKRYLGSEQIPFIETFTDDTSFRNFRTVDINDDGFEWQPYDYEAGAEKLSYDIYSFTPSLSGRLSGDNISADDYMVLPTFYLEKDKKYKFETSLRVLRNIKEFELYAKILRKSGETAINTADTPIELISGINLEYPEITIQSQEGEKYYSYFSVEESGYYDLAIYVRAPEDGISEININAVSLTEAEDVTVPSEVKEAAFARNYDNAKSVKVSFVAPTEDLAGNALQSISKIEVKRFDMIVKTFNNPQPGEYLEFTDRAHDVKLISYSIVASNESGMGQPIYHSLFTSSAIPPAVLNPIIEETDDSGTVHLSWTQPLNIDNGRTLDQSQIRYRIVDAISEDSDVVADNVEGNEIVISNEDSSNSQREVRYGVIAFTPDGEAEMVTTSDLLIGKPYEVPFRESFDSAKLSHYMNFIGQENISKWIIKDSYNGIMPYDNDGGFLTCNFEQDSDTTSSATAITGKIKVSEMTKPILSFMLYNSGNSSQGDDNFIEISVRNLNEKEAEWKSMLIGVVDNLSEHHVDQWSEVKIDLSEYIDETVQIAFKVKHTTNTLTPIDNIMVTEGFGNSVSEIASNKYCAYAENDIIWILKPAGECVSVTNIEGSVVYRGKPEGSLGIRVGKGTYIVNIGKETFKLIVG